jgi:hypothetical protein
VGPVERSLRAAMLQVDHEHNLLQLLLAPVVGVLGHLGRVLSVLARGCRVRHCFFAGGELASERVTQQVLFTQEPVPGLDDLQPARGE